MLSSIILYTLGIAVGNTILAFFVAEFLCILLSGFSTTIKLMHIDFKAHYGKIFSSLICHLIINFIIIFSILYLIYCYFELPYWFKYGVAFGVFIAIIRGIWFCFPSNVNLEDYYKHYSKYFIEACPPAFKKTVYCKRCGQPLDDDKKCTGCGKQYFRFRKVTLKPNIAIVMAIFLGISVYQNYTLYNLYTDATESCSYLSGQNSNLKNTITRLTNENNDYEEKLDTLRENYQELSALKNQYKATADYWDDYGALATEYGTKYHKYSCQYLENAETIYVMTIWEAEDLGYLPCSECYGN